MNYIARRTTSWLFRIASIGSVLLFGLTGCDGGSSQPAGVSGTWTDIDTSYGKQGQATFSLDVQNGGVGPSVLQADGKLVIAGWRQTGSLPANNAGGNPPRQVYVLRLNGDGSPDTTFGVGGEVRFNVKGSDTVADVKLQPDGKILLAVNSIEPCVAASPGFCLIPAGGVASFVSALVRLTPQGALDSTFGGTGIVGTAATTSGLALAAVQTDGKILFLRSTSLARARIFGWSLARYNVDGTPDSTFNQGNSISSECASDGESMVVQADGRIVVGGAEGVWYAEPTINPGFCLERINADGSHDSGFRAAGLWTKFDANVQFNSNSLSAVSNEGLLAVGRTCDHTTCGVVASRYDADGLLDTSFGVAGIVKLAIDNTFRLTDYVLTPVGDLVILGFQTPSAVTGQPQQYQPIWIRLDVNGQPASGFGANGILSGTPDTKLPQNFLRDQEGRWLVINSSIMSDGNLGIVVTRLIGEQLVR